MCAASSLPAPVAVITIVLRDVLLLAVLAIDDVPSIHSALSAKAFGQISNIVYFARVPLVAISALVRFLGTRGGRCWCLFRFLHARGFIVVHSFLYFWIDTGDITNFKRSKMSGGQGLGLGLDLDSGVVEIEEVPDERLNPSASARRFCRSSLLPWMDILG